VSHEQVGYLTKATTADCVGRARRIFAGTYPRPPPSQTDRSHVHAATPGPRVPGRAGAQRADHHPSHPGGGASSGHKKRAEIPALPSSPDWRGAPRVHWSLANNVQHSVLHGPRLKQDTIHIFHHSQRYERASKHANSATNAASLNCEPNLKS
jgi:hypothetical protein